MVERERLLAKLEEIDAYVRELRTVAPAGFDDYREARTKRACERLLQIAIEAVIDVCGMLVKGLRLGLPAEEDDLFEKLAAGGVIPVPMAGTLQRMRRFRNVLVHEYVRVDDALALDVIQHRLGDFEDFKRAVLAFLRPAPGE